MNLTLIYKKIIKEINLILPVMATYEEIEKVYNFFINYNDFRLLENCSLETGLSIYKCARIKKYLYKKRRLGSYFFEADVPPQKYMREYILKKFSSIKNDSCILEVGPGEFPVFDFKDFSNWYGVDKFFSGGSIEFRCKGWAKNKYPIEKIKQAEYENLSDEMKNMVEKFDLVVGSHSYEHTLKPILSLRESFKMLKKGGILVLFVPDGFSDDINSKDPTHTLYINKDMMIEFFEAAGGFENIEIKTFRPNADLVISAIKS